MQCGLLERTRQHFLQRLSRRDIQQQPRCHQLSNLPVLRGGALACPARGRPFAPRAAACPAPFPLNHSPPHLRAIAQGTYSAERASSCTSCAPVRLHALLVGRPFCHLAAGLQALPLTTHPPPFPQLPLPHRRARIAALVRGRAAPQALGAPRVPPPASPALRGPTAARRAPPARPSA